MSQPVLVLVASRLSSVFFFSSRRRHTRCSRDWSSDVCSSDLIFQNSRLIAFDGEMVMRLALGDQIVGQLALRQQGIGTDLLALNGDGFEQWDGGLDLVGAFDLDRKSTRLNSSHGYISYAVFCLKKKKT